MLHCQRLVWPWAVLPPSRFEVVVRALQQLGGTHCYGRAGYLCRRRSPAAARGQIELTATGGTRTPNLRFTKPLLFRLSYSGATTVRFGPAHPTRHADPPQTILIAHHSQAILWVRGRPLRCSPPPRQAGADAADRPVWHATTFSRSAGAVRPPARSRRPNQSKGDHDPSRRWGLTRAAGNGCIRFCANGLTGN